LQIAKLTDYRCWIIIQTSLGGGTDAIDPDLYLVHQVSIKRVLLVWFHERKPKSDPTKEPAFQKTLANLSKMKPNPLSEMKVGKK
jgi:hypothetical protein